MANAIVPASGQAMPGRRQVIKQGAAIAAGLALGASGARHAGAVETVQAGMDICNPLKIRGVNYDTGTNYMGGELPRQIWNPEAVDREIRVIHDDLNCNAIGIFGTNMQRLTQAASTALRHGLQVWVQPRLFEAEQKDVLAYLGDIAEAAQTVSVRHNKPVVFNIGCEFTLFTQGFVAGTNFFERLQTLTSATSDLFPKVNTRLEAFLKEAAKIARSRFKGEITYSPTLYERVDWSLFDIVSANHYRDEHNRATYADTLRRLKRHGKPVVVTEFGCSTFEGAEKMGGMGFDIVDHEQDPPLVKPGFVRSEKAQADEIAALLKIFEDEKVDGAFVYQFLAEDSLYSADPRRDHDMASHAIVKTLNVDIARGKVHWEPKLAFHEIARIYARPQCP